jgi:hypothetical protein
MAGDVYCKQCMKVKEQQTAPFGSQAQLLAQLQVHCILAFFD